MTTTTLLQGTTDAELGLGQVAGGAPAQFEIDGDGTAHFALGTTMDQVFETMGEDPFDLGGTEELGYTATPRNVPTVLVAVSADDITREELEAILPDEMLGDRVFDVTRSESGGGLLMKDLGAVGNELRLVIEKPADTLPLETATAETDRKAA